MYGPADIEGATLQPLTEQTASAFRLGTERVPRRAKPAWRWSEARRIAVRERTASGETSRRDAPTASL